MLDCLILVRRMQHRLLTSFGSFILYLKLYWLIAELQKYYLILFSERRCFEPLPTGSIYQYEALVTKFIAWYMNNEMICLTLRQ